MKVWVNCANIFGGYYVVFVVLIGNLLGIFTGMSLGWSSPVLIKLNGTDDNPLGRPISQDENDWIGSVFTIGGATGPIILLYALELLGRKYTLGVLASIFSVSYFILAFTADIYLIYICRIAIGVAVSGSFCVAPVYIAEISSTKMRGTYLSLETSCILTGILISYSLGPSIDMIYLNLIIAISSLIYLPVLIFCCPESPYHIMKKCGYVETAEVLQKLRLNEDIQEELVAIKTTVETEDIGTFLDIFRSKAGFEAFKLCTILLVLQQFCGVNVIITYIQQIFQDANVTLKPDVCTILVGIVQFLTCFNTPLAAKRLNRKFLLNVSFIGVAVSHAIMALYFSISSLKQYSWISVVSLVLFVTFYNCGLGALPWATLGELYPLNIKPIGTAVSTVIYWIFQFILTYYFNKIDRVISFSIFSVICFSSIVFIQVFFIETRGKSLQEIQNILRN